MEGEKGGKERGKRGKRGGGGREVWGKKLEGRRVLCYLKGINKNNQ